LMLGIEVERDDTTIKLKQQKYIDQVLQVFNMQDCKKVTTPATKETNIEDEKKLFDDITLYQSAIGSLNYISIHTRPDISFAVNQAARKMKNPSIADWQKAKRILRYLQGTKELQLTLSKEKPPELKGYSDASYAEEKDRKSTSGYVFMKNGGPISWKSSKQHIIALSSTEAEYISLTDAANEAMWLRNFDREIKNQSNTVEIFEDNQSAIHLSSDNIFSHRTKHIEVRYHFIREKVLNKDIKLTYCPTDLMIADIFTKPLDRVKHLQLPTALGLS